MSAAHAAPEPQEAAAQQPQWPSTPREDCERMVERAQTRNMTVKFMIDKMKEVCIGTAKLLHARRWPWPGFPPVCNAAQHAAATPRRDSPRYVCMALCADA